MNKILYLILAIFIALVLSSCTPKVQATEVPVRNNPQEPQQTGNEPNNPSEADFDPITANQSTPEDIEATIKQISFNGTGGGDDDDQLCKDINSPLIMSEWTEIEQMQLAWVSMCGWDINSKVTANLRGPNGFNLSDNVNIFLNIAYWEYSPDINSPTGDYKVEFTDGKRSLEFNFSVSLASEPGIKNLYKAKEIQIYNFKPLEQIRVLFYEAEQGQLVFLGWKEYSADNKGNLLLHVLDAYGNYAIIGEQSGEFRIGQFGQSVQKSNNRPARNETVCAGAPITHLATGVIARVTFTDGTPTRIRNIPGTSGSIIGKLAEGTQFRIINGPKCSDGYTWWQIELENGTHGWSAEGSNSSYFIEPINSMTMECEETASRLVIGVSAIVSYVDGGNMRIRKLPGFSEEITSKVPEGTTVQIIGGPKCVDGNNWWKVRTDSNVEGWMTESQNGTYLLEPK